MENWLSRLRRGGAGLWHNYSERELDNILRMSLEPQAPSPMMSGSGGDEGAFGSIW